MNLLLLPPSKYMRSLLLQGLLGNEPEHTLSSESEFTDLTVRLSSSRSSEASSDEQQDDVFLRPEDRGVSAKVQFPPQTGEYTELWFCSDHVLRVGLRSESVRLCVWDWTRHI